MKKAALFRVAILLLGIQAIWAQGISEADSRSKIVALEHVAKLQACENRDLKTLDELLDPNFFYIDPGGRLQTKGQIMAFQLKTHSLHCRINAMEVRLHNNTAIVTGLFETKGMVDGDPYTAKGRFVDTWLLEDGLWLEIASLATPER